MDCENCKLREYYARVWDIHFDYLDCPFDYLDCPYKEKCKYSEAEFEEKGDEEL